MKVQVHVLYPTGEKVNKKKTEFRGEKEIVIMRKSGKNRSPWNFEIPDGAIIPRKGFRTSFHVLVKPDAAKAIVMKSDLKPEDIPVWDKHTSWRFIQAELLKRRGEEPTDKSNMAIWLLAVLIIMGYVITFIASGRIRIG